jgi:hypothetical protein
MASFKSTILTQKAHALMAKLTAGTATSTFTKIKSSEYDYSALTSTQLEALTSIEDVKQEVLVSEVTRINEASVKVSATLVNTELTTGYYIKTIALYANDPDEGEILYSVTVATESDWMPPYNSISSASALFDLITTVSNAENVSIDVDPNAVATITQLNDVKDYVICNKELVSINHGLSGYPRVNLTYTESGAGVGGAGLFPAGANSECNSLQNRAVYTDNNNLTIYVPSNYYVENPSVNKINDYKYIVTFGNNTKSILISLIKENIEEEIELKADNTDLNRTTTDKTVTGAINELDANVNQLSNPNLLINGNFDFWQRGTSISNPTGLVYLADRFKIVNLMSGTLPTTITHSKQSVTPGDIIGATNFYRVSVTGNGVSNNNDFYLLVQCIENGVRKLCGQGEKITLSFWARSSIQNKKLGIHFDQVYGSGGTPTATEHLKGVFTTLTSNWTKYSFTFNTNTLTNKIFGTNNDDRLDLMFDLAYGSTIAPLEGDIVAENFSSGTIDIAQIKLEEGDKVTPFIPMKVSEELALCQRYYENNFLVGGHAVVDSNGKAIMFIPYKVTKPIKPTISTDSSLLSSCLSEVGYTTKTPATIGYADRGMNGTMIIFTGLTDIVGCTVTIADNSALKNLITADAEIY